MNNPNRNLNKIDNSKHNDEINQLSEEIHQDSDYYRDMISKSNLEVRAMIEDIKNKSLGLSDTRLFDTRNLDTKNQTLMNTHKSGKQSIAEIISPQFNHFNIDNYYDENDNDNDLNVNSTGKVDDNAVNQINDAYQQSFDDKKGGTNE